MNMVFPSVESRIRNSLLVLVLPAFILLLVALHSAMTKIANQYVVNRLQQDAENVITALVENEGRWYIDESRLSSVYKRVRAGHYYVVRWPEGELRSRSLWDFTPVFEPLRPGESAEYQQQGAGDERWLVWQEGIRKNQQEFTVWVAEDINAFADLQKQYGNYLLIFLALVIAVVLILQRKIIRSGFATLKPFQDGLIRGQTQTIKTPEDIPTEIKPLADAIGRLVRHSGEQVSRSRMAVGNLAHELKLPLQHLQILATAESYEDNREQLLEIYTQLKRRIDSELRRARISGSPAPGERFNPGKELPYLITLLNRKGPHQIECQMELPEAELPFDRDDMLELIGNLLDNAWRFAASRVVIEIRETDSGWIVSIADDGPGIPEQDIERLQQRGVRQDEQGDRNFGLGLSICRSVVQSYRGKLMLQAGPLGGLQVLITLPQSGMNCMEPGEKK